MKNLLIWEDIPCEFYPASLMETGIFFSLRFPDFPEIAPINERSIQEALATAEINLGWAIRKRTEQNLLFPYASDPSTVPGEVCLIKPAPTPPIISEE